MSWANLSNKDWIKESFLAFGVQADGVSTRDVVNGVWAVAKKSNVSPVVVPKTFHWPSLKEKETRVLGNVSRLLKELNMHGEIKKKEERISDFGGLRRFLWYSDDFKKMDSWYLYHLNAFGVRNPYWKEIRKKVKG